MTYYEVVRRLSLKLKGWEQEVYRDFICFREKGKPCLEFTVRSNKVKGLGCICLWSSDQGVLATEVEDMLDGYCEATSEEAELFKLEHGFDYPKELINDL